MAARDTYIRVTGRYAELAQGIITYDDLDDEELARGQLRSADGTFRGNRPNLIPKEMVDAMRRAWMGRAEARLREALLKHGVGVLIELAKDPLVDPAVRLRASEKIIERTMGKVPDKVEMSVEDPVETLFKKILSDPNGLEAPVLHEPSAEERELLS